MFLQQYHLTESCLVLGTDSTAINTGWKGGDIAYFEKLLRHKCHFVDIPETIMNNMSTDQKQSNKLCKVVKIGELPPNLREIQCDPLSHARWLTTGMIIVFMWTRKHYLSNKNLENLELLVLFCLQFYFKHFSDIKVKDKFEDASYHILSQLRILRNQPDRVKEIVTPYIHLGA